MLEANNLIVPLVGNFAGPKTLRAVGAVGRGARRDGHDVLRVERRAVPASRTASGPTLPRTSRRCRSTRPACSSGRASTAAQPPSSSRVVMLLDSLPGLLQRLPRAAGFATYYDVLAVRSTREECRPTALRRRCRLRYVAGTLRCSSRPRWPWSRRAAPPAGRCPARCPLADGRAVLEALHRLLRAERVLPVGEPRLQRAHVSSTSFRRCSRPRAGRRLPGRRARSELHLHRRRSQPHIAFIVDIRRGNLLST